MDIVAYLEDLRPDPPLYPADPARREEMQVFIDWFNAVWKLWPNGIEAELGKPDPDDELITAHSAEMAVALDRFEVMLDGRSHLMGEDFSAADVCVFPFLRFALVRDPDDEELFHRILEEHQRLGDDHPRLADWIRRVDERPRA
jgi:maleylacetoacetate isomerase